MKVLLVNGSPHKKGCTFTALEEIQKTLNEEDIGAEIFHIGNVGISPNQFKKGESKSSVISWSTKE